MKNIWFEPHDLWVGVYWKWCCKKPHSNGGKRDLHIYVCLLPTLVWYKRFDKVR